MVGVRLHKMVLDRIIFWSSELGTTPIPDGRKIGGMVTILTIKTDLIINIIQVYVVKYEQALKERGKVIRSFETLRNRFDSSENGPVKMGILFQHATPDHLNLTSKHKKVLLRERKRHTAHRVASPLMEGTYLGVPLARVSTPRQG